MDTNLNLSSIEKDTVNHPDHYCNGSIECVDAMIAAYGKKDVEIFCRVNAFKYLWRCKYKNNYNEDLSKALWYLNKAEELNNQ